MTSKVTTTISNALTNLMSAYYLDYAKDILYIEKVDASSRREIQTVLYGHCLLKTDGANLSSYYRRTQSNIPT